jgi:hypothetical protein
MHTDNATSEGSDAIIASAQAHHVPVISAKQMLDWLDGRNSSSFGSMSWNGNALTFSVTAGNGADSLRAMLPVNSETGYLQSISWNGAAITFSTQTIKGIQYAFFNAPTGNYVAIYGSAPIAKTTSPALAGNLYEEELHIVVSPNPTMSDFVLSTKSNVQKPVEVRVTDMFGRNVYRITGSGNETYRFGSSFNSGVYIIQVIQGNKTKNLKVVKGN